MAHRIPSLQSLLVLDAAVKHGNFTKAADALSLTHGAVSQHIRTLQNRLGARLFVREGRGMRPTPACLALVGKVRQAISLLDRSFPASPRRAAYGRLTVSVLPHFATGWLISRLPRFTAIDERLAVDLVGSHLIDDIADRGIDAGIRFGPGWWPGLIAEHLANETAFPVCAPSFLPSTRGGLSNLGGRAFLRSPFPPWEPWLQAANLQLKAEPSGAHFGDPSLLIATLLAGQGVGLVRRLIVMDDLRQGRLVRLSEIAVDEPFGYYLVWRPDNPHKKLIREFCEWLRHEINATLADADTTVLGFRSLKASERV
jgi:LysR family transcriptional regulator, glycine cleavage system transcriptional activator